MGDAKSPTDAAKDATRVATTRGLLPTSTQNLLLDPFTTYDTSWGHFVWVDPTTHDLCNNLTREFLSQSPIGITGGVAKVALAGNCTQVLAPLSGASSGRVDTQMWISLSDASGAALPFPATNLDAWVKVALVPNYLPSQTPQPIYALDVVTVSPISPADGGTLPLTISGREWGLVGASGVPFTQGGFFVITLVSGTGSFYFAAPEVVPTNAVSLDRPHVREMGDVERAAIRRYGEVAHGPNRPRPRFGSY
jgi:hypothetical protein